MIFYGRLSFLFEIQIIQDKFLMPRCPLFLLAGYNHVIRQVVVFLPWHPELSYCPAPDWSMNKWLLLLLSEQGIAL
jgi:hypothetical protein